MNKLKWKRPESGCYVADSGHSVIRGKAGWCAKSTVVGLGGYSSLAEAKDACEKDLHKCENCSSDKGVYGPAGPLWEPTLCAKCRALLGTEAPCDGYECKNVGEYMVDPYNYEINRGAVSIEAMCPECYEESCMAI